MISMVKQQMSKMTATDPALNEAIIDNIRDGLIITDLHGGIIHWNQAADRYLLPVEEYLDAEKWPEVLGLYLDDGITLFPGERMPLARALRGENVLTEEVIWRPNEQSAPRWLSITAQSLDLADGSPAGVMVTIRDITENKRIELSREKHAWRNEALYKFSHAIAESGNDLDQITAVVARQAAERIGDACIVLLTESDSQHLRVASHYHSSSEKRSVLRKCLLTVNHSLEASLLGGVLRSGEPMLIPSIQPEQLQAIFIQELASYVHEYGVHSLLVAPITGSTGVLGAVILVRDQNSKAYTLDEQNFLMYICNRTALAVENCHLFGSLRAEIEKWLQAERALENSEERFRSIFESTSLGIKILDVDGNILQTNPAFRDISGYSQTELIGRPFHQLMHPRDAVHALRLIRDLKLSGVPDFRFEHRILNRDGQVIWVKTSFTAVKNDREDETLAFIVGIVENINEKKRIDAEMTELKSRLHAHLERERLRLAQELHDGAMQELYSAIYQIEALRGQVGVEFCPVLDNVKGDLQHVLGELRNTAKELRPPTIADFGLEKAIRSHVQDYQEKYPELSIHLSLAPDNQLLPEEVRLTLFRIFQQSLVNVIRHAQANHVNVSFTFDAEEAHLEIADDGIGFNMPSNMITLTRNGHYGLAGGAERVDALGGEMKVDSMPGQGTRVHVTIPLQNATLNENLGESS